MTVELEHVEEPPDKPPWRDPLDSTGKRCGVMHDDVGPCHRKFDHVTRGDPWHYAITGYDELTKRRLLWRWRDTDRG